MADNVDIDPVYKEGSPVRFNTNPFQSVTGERPLMASYIIEPGVTIGSDTVIWHFTQVRSGAVIGKNCTIGSHVLIGPNVRIGDNCKIENFAFIPEGVTIGDGVFIGPHVCFTNDKYPRAVNREGAKIEADGWQVWQTVVHDRAVIAAGAVILPECDIGSGAQVGAGAVVTRPVRSKQLVIGNPAREVIRVQPEFTAEGSED